MSLRRILIMLFFTLLIPDCIHAQEARSELHVNYRVEGKSEAFYRAVYLNEPGYEYHIASPELEGYRPDASRVSGSFPDGTEVEVIYHLQTYMLTIHYRHLNGDIAAPDFIDVFDFGTDYEVETPYISGYTAVKDSVEGVMPGRDVEWTVFYVPESAVFVK